MISTHYSPGLRFIYLVYGYINPLKATGPNNKENKPDLPNYNTIFRIIQFLGRNS